MARTTFRAILKHIPLLDATIEDRSGAEKRSRAQCQREVCGPVSRTMTYVVR